MVPTLPISVGAGAKSVVSIAVNTITTNAKRQRILRKRTNDRNGITENDGKKIPNTANGTEQRNVVPPGKCGKMPNATAW